LDAPPEVAVSVAVVAVETADTVAVKLALVEPDATVTEDGTTTDELLLESVTVWPPLAAAAFSVAVQLSVPAPVIELDVQLRLLSTG
jgi:hypothetical protein